MLDGLSKIAKLVEKVKAMGQTAIGITDHGAMYGTIEFYNACKKGEIKPIIGLEAYVASKSRLDKQTKMGGDQAHMTLLATNFEGYQNLMKLVTASNLEGFSYKPRIDDEILEKYSAGIIAFSGCMSSRFNKFLLEDKKDEAIALAQKYAAMFPDRFYIELQAHPAIKELKKLTKLQVAIARELNLPLVATNDVHYVEEDDAQAQDALLCVQTRKLLDDTKRMKMIDSPDFYLRSTQEMIDLFIDYPEAIENTVKIADQCDIQIPTGKLIFPNFPIPEGETPASYLEKMTFVALETKFAEITPEIRDRANYELNIINTKGYPTYFLITQDFVNWAKNQGIGVGPGRGSVAGSLVSYAIGITEINPLEHNLPFERFLNPERPTPPDIDMDFADDRRQEVIEYVAQKYGEDHVASVITFGRMEPRVATRDIGRVMGLPYEEPDKIAKLIPNNPAQKITIEKAIETVPELAEYYKQPKFKKLMDLVKKVEGTVRHNSVHAAAIIIADKPLPEYTPLQQDSKTGKMVTQYDMRGLDCNVDDNAIGLLKFDFLGLRNLSTIQEAIRLIKEISNTDLIINKIPLTDKKTYQLLSNGDTVGVFQLESAGMRRVARNLQPSQFSDIAALLALYRPGPMELIPQFIEGKHHPESVKYPHDSLEPVLKETYGVMVYQEQVMQIFSTMAGYSLGEADMIRRAMGKKKIKILNENKKRFIEESFKRGYAKTVADQVWQYIMAFANYGFNKAHAASYAMISYQTAYLKANFPVEYMAALMSVEAASHNANRDEKVAFAIETTKQMGIKVLPPDINLSEDAFNIEKHPGSLQDLAIRFGFDAIKNVGTEAVKNILSTRKKEGKFNSFSHFISATDSRKVNKKVLESLIKVGCMDQFGTRSSMLENLEDIKKRVSQFETGPAGQDHLFAGLSQSISDLKDNFVKIPEYPLAELLSFEKELLGLYLTDHPLGDALRNVSARATKTIDDLDLTIHKSQVFLFGGVITKYREVSTKMGKPMAFGTLEDQTGKIEFVVFPKTFQQLTEKLAADMVILLKARVDEREGEKQLIVEKVTIPDESLLNAIPDEKKHEVFIPRKTSQETMQAIGKLLKAEPGNERVVVIIPNGAQPKKMLLPYGVAWNEKLEKQIEKLLS